jgi:hypothetical protein
MSASGERLEAVLAAESRRWEARSWEELSALDDLVCYELPGGLQVELNVLERTPEYVHVGIAIDDGTLLRSIVPRSTSILVKRGVTL